mgnify:FL=1
MKYGRLAIAIDMWIDDGLFDALKKADSIRSF